MSDFVVAIEDKESTVPRSYWTIQGSKEGLGVALHF